MSECSIPIFFLNLTMILFYLTPNAKATKAEIRLQQTKKILHSKRGSKQNEKKQLIEQGKYL